MRFAALVAFMVAVALPFFVVFDRRGIDEKQTSKKLRLASNKVERLKSNASSYTKPFKSAPNAKEYLEQVRSNPADVPDSLASFAANLGIEMDKARTNLKAAVTLFNKLALCASEDSGEEAFIVKSICAENARSLAEAYPQELKANFQTLSIKLDNRIRQMVN